MLIAFSIGVIPSYSQIELKTFQMNTKFDEDKEGDLCFEIDNLNFFRNNEYAGKVQHGYSLPGLWIQPKLVYYPLHNLKLELGLHGLIYHGAQEYPNAIYRDIPRWEENGYQYGVHLLPFLRAHMVFTDYLSLVVGNIYGGSNHGLIAPLYNPEMNLSADPETGLQILLDTKPFRADVWLNWESFIFREDTHQEVFTVGLSSELRFNNPDSRFHFFMPVQGVIQHLGGEIDTITVNSISSMANGSVGLGAQWNVNQKGLKDIRLATHFAGYTQLAGELWPKDSGYGSYTELSANIHDFHVKTGYWWNSDYISILGNPFFGALSLIEENGVYKNPHMFLLGAQYTKSFGKGYSLGVDLNIFHRFSDTLSDPINGSQSVGASTSFAFGVYFRANPSFLLKKFK